jgi:hypothetical protein
MILIVERDRTQRELWYVEEGPVFDDAGLPHGIMRKKLRA